MDLKEMGAYLTTPTPRDMLRSRGARLVREPPLTSRTSSPMDGTAKPDPGRRRLAGLAEQASPADYRRRRHDLATGARHRRWTAG
jgi:hypothetical protein